MDPYHNQPEVRNTHRNEQKKFQTLSPNQLSPASFQKNNMRKNIGFFKEQTQHLYNASGRVDQLHENNKIREFLENPSRSATHQLSSEEQVKHNHTPKFKTKKDPSQFESDSSIQISNNNTSKQSRQKMRNVRAVSTQRHATHKNQLLNNTSMMGMQNRKQSQEQHPLVNYGFIPYSMPVSPGYTQQQLNINYGQILNDQNSNMISNLFQPQYQFRATQNHFHQKNQSLDADILGRQGQGLDQHNSIESGNRSFKTSKASNNNITFDRKLINFQQQNSSIKQQAFKSNEALKQRVKELELALKNSQKKEIELQKLNTDQHYKILDLETQLKISDASLTQVKDQIADKNQFIKAMNELSTQRQEQTLDIKADNIRLKDEIEKLRLAKNIKSTEEIKEHSDHNESSPIIKYVPYRSKTDQPDVQQKYSIINQEPSKTFKEEPDKNMVVRLAYGGQGELLYLKQQTAHEEKKQPVVKDETKKLIKQITNKQVQRNDTTTSNASSRRIAFKNRNNIGSDYVKMETAGAKTAPFDSIIIDESDYQDDQSQPELPGIAEEEAKESSGESEHKITVEKLNKKTDMYQEPIYVQVQKGLLGKQTLIMNDHSCDALNQDLLKRARKPPSILNIVSSGLLDDFNMKVSKVSLLFDKKKMNDQTNILMQFIVKFSSEIIYKKFHLRQLFNNSIEDYTYFEDGNSDPTEVEVLYNSSFTSTVRQCFDNKFELNDSLMDEFVKFFGVRGLGSKSPQLKNSVPIRFKKLEQSLQHLDQYHLNKDHGLELDHITPICGRNLNQIAAHLKDLSMSVLELIEAKIKRKQKEPTIILDKLEEIIRKADIVTPPLNLQNLIMVIGLNQQPDIQIVKLQLLLDLCLKSKSYLHSFGTQQRKPGYGTQGSIMRKQQKQNEIEKTIQMKIQTEKKQIIIEEIKKQHLESSFNTDSQDQEDVEDIQVGNMSLDKDQKIESKKEITQVTESMESSHSFQSNELNNQSSASQSSNFSHCSPDSKEETST